MAALKFLGLIFLAYSTILADAGGKFCRKADKKLDELKTLIENNTGNKDELKTLIENMSELKTLIENKDELKTLIENMGELKTLIENMDCSGQGSSSSGGSSGPSGLTSCKEIFDKSKPKENKEYMLQMDNMQVPVYCYMDGADLGSCGGGGWTMVMKIDGTKETFLYDSAYWTDKNPHNLLGGKTGLDQQETKLPTYWNTPFTKICLGMKIPGQNTRFLVLNKEASSLHALIADDKYRPTSLGRNTWKALVGPEASLQRNCNKEGFNVMSKDVNRSKVRIGFLANQENECISGDSRIGFGTGGLMDKSNSCGNEATFSPDNGIKHIKAMGYILVQ